MTFRARCYDILDGLYVSRFKRAMYGILEEERGEEKANFSLVKEFM